jgi:hypothetical protein
MKKIFLVLLVISTVCHFHYVLTAINIHLFIYLFIFIYKNLPHPPKKGVVKKHLQTEDGARVDEI